MAPINDGISHPHNRPGSNVCNLREVNIHPCNRPYDAASAIFHKSRRTVSSGNNNNNTTTNDIPPPSPTPSTTDDNEGHDPDNTPPSPDDTADGGMSTLEKMLSPPESDMGPHSKHLDVKVYHSHSQPNLTMGPFIPQPPSPPKEKPGPRDCRKDNFMKRLRRTLNERSNTSNADASDGDNEGGVEDNDSPDESNLEAPDMLKSTTSTTASHVSPPTTPRRVPRSQEPDHDSDSETPSPRTIAPKPKRKRTNSTIDAATPTKGQRVSKRQRKSIGDSPLPPMPPIKRTRAEQKKFQAKLDHLVFDPQRPGSVEREAVEIKSGAKEWRKASLHDELWDGNSKAE